MGTWGLRCVLIGLLLQSAGCQEDRTSPPSSPELVWPSLSDSSPKRSDLNVHWLDFDTQSPTPVAVHPEGHQVAVRTPCETIVYDLRSGLRRHSWADTTTVSQFSRDGRFLLTTKKGDVAVWDTETFVELQRFTGNPPAWNGRSAR